MPKIIDKLKEKILTDCDIAIPENAILKRRKLSWQAATAGRNKWYWYCPGQLPDLTIIGSQEDMKDLLKCNKIEHLSIHGQTELSSS